jgi:hypothetical protein
MVLTKSNTKQIKEEITEYLYFRDIRNRTVSITVDDHFLKCKLAIEKSDYETPCQSCNNRDCTDLNKLFWCRFYKPDEHVELNTIH